MNVSVIIPARNEEKFLARCLDSVYAQTVPPLEVILADGMSEDQTREIAGEYAEKYGNLIVLDNPEKIAPTALNRAIRLSKGEAIARVDAHCLLEPDYLEECLSALERSGADNVGGPMRAEGIGTIPEAIALATSSPFGVGNALFHYATDERWVDTVYLGCYRREVFEKIGCFDEELVRNQDDELNFRLTQSGGKILLSPRIRSTYYNRASLRKLFSQYFQYGFWKVRVIQKHGRPASWRHLVPGAFVLALLASLLALPWSFLPFAFLWGAYLPAASFFAARLSWKKLPLLVLIFFILHVSYGAGFLSGLGRALGKK